MPPTTSPWPDARTGSGDVETARHMRGRPDGCEGGLLLPGFAATATDPRNRPYRAPGPGPRCGCGSDRLSVAPGHRFSGSWPGAAWCTWFGSPNPHPGRGSSAISGAANGASATGAAASATSRRRMSCSPGSMAGRTGLTDSAGDDQPIISCHGLRHDNRLLRQARASTWPDGSRRARAWSTSMTSRDTYRAASLKKREIVDRGLAEARSDVQLRSSAEVGTSQSAASEDQGRAGATARP